MFTGTFGDRGVGTFTPVLEIEAWHLSREKNPGLSRKEPEMGSKLQGPGQVLLASKLSPQKMTVSTGPQCPRDWMATTITG